MKAILNTLDGLSAVSEIVTWISQRQQGTASSSAHGLVNCKMKV